MVGRVPKGSFAYYPLHTIPTSLDVVWCRFPLEELPEKPGPKERPALVRAVYLYDKQTKAAVEVTYGTSRIETKIHYRELQISNCEEMAASGLYQATVFVLDKTVLLPWAKEFFAARDGYKSPIVGHLPQSAISQLEALKVMRRKR
jgi:hypothetical protein